ncbi:MAG TPA: hypothetical protein VFL85_00205 [Candidatus Saccharimonadales bacterium]|nr:hypothetical protein [Candidatus Saccharimonadales bacterium]
MQNIKTKENHRSHPVRIAAIGLAAVTLFSLTEVGRHTLVKTSAVLHDNIGSILMHTLEKENETTRMPIRFDEGYRPPTVSGS